MPPSEHELRLRERLSRLRAMPLLGGAKLSGELERLQRQLERIEAEPTDADIWRSVELARHPDRPYTLDYVTRLLDDWFELHGDRSRGDDGAMVAGLGKLEGRTVALVGQQKGRDIQERTRRQFGMPYPEGYRKALRMMKLAEKFHVPVITFIDTQGAWAGLGAEERGQSEAIARNLYEMSQLQVPIVATVIGEGGSGGALALGVADRVLMMENAVYSVISVEGCAAILWKDAKSPEMREKAAAALRITAPELLELKVIDEVVPEPKGGAHADHETSAKSLQAVLIRNLEELRKMRPEKLVRPRRQKFLRLGAWQE